MIYVNFKDFRRYTYMTQNEAFESVKSYALLTYVWAQNEARHGY